MKEIKRVRLKNEGVIEILIDLWSENSAIWELNILTLKYHMVKDFNKYKDEEHTNNIDW